MKSYAEARGFDFHCHVDLDRDPTALVRRFDQERIVTLAVTTTPRAWPQNRKWAAQSRFMIPALGLHPELVTERHREISILEASMPDARFIGEIGLDGSPKHRGSFAIQQEVLGRILAASERLGGRVLTLHSRWAADQVVDMIGRYTTAERVLPVLHWFSGSAASARRAAEVGCWFSVNGQMLGNERGQAVVRGLPLDRLLTETDSPFTKEGSRASMPWDVIGTAAKLAAVYGMPAEKMQGILSENAKRVLTFAGAE